jgi:hypothetical protein
LAKFDGPAFADTGESVDAASALTGTASTAAMTKEVATDIAAPSAKPCITLIDENISVFILCSGKSGRDIFRQCSKAAKKKQY